MRLQWVGLLGLFAVLACAPDQVVAPGEEVSSAAAAGVTMAKSAAGITQLADPPGTSGSHALAVNDAGYVVGYSRAMNGCSHIVIWDPVGVPTDLGTCGIANDVNNLNQIVGSLDPLTPGGDIHAFVWDKASGFLDLGTLGGPWSIAYGIADNGWVVGYSQLAGGGDGGFLYTPADGMQDLAQLTGVQIMQGMSVNKYGDVLAWGSIGGFVWNESAGVRVIPSLVAGSSLPSIGYRINDRGWVAGSGVGGNGNSRAFLWVPGSAPVELGVLASLPDPTLDRSNAFGLSANGLVVGESLISDNQIDNSAFVWTKARGMRALPNLGTPRCYAYDVNSRGKIAVGVCVVGGSPVAVKWGL